jgi:putative ABC transport system permease protein
MRGIKLLIKNAFRSAWRNIYQIFGLSTLILLVSVISSLILSASGAIIGANNDLKHDSNLRDVVVQVDNAKLRVSSEEAKKLDVDWTTAQEIYQQREIEEAIKALAQENGVAPDAIQWSRTEGRTFTEIKNGNNDLQIKTIAKYSDNVLMSQNSSTVDKLIVTDGPGFDSDVNLAKHEVVLQKTFADAMKIKVGDIVRFAKDSFSKDKGDQLVVTKDATIKSTLNGRSWAHIAADTTSDNPYPTANWFEVVGYGVSADFSAPIIDETTTLPDIKKNLLAYLDASNFGFVTDASDDTQVHYNYRPEKATLTLVSDYDREVYFSIKLPSSIDQDKFAIALNTKLNSAFNIKTGDKYVYANDDSAYPYYSRISMFPTVSTVFTIVSTILLLIVIIISMLTIILMTKKYVESIQKQIGCLKALGYKKREVVNNFIAIPLITSAIGCICGYLISIGVGQAVLLGFKQYFNVNFGGITFNLWSFLASIVGTFVIMLLIAYCTAYWTIRRSPLDLLRGDADRQSGVMARSFKKLTISKSFNGRLRGALMASSAGKLVGMTGTMLLSTILMSATAMAPKIMKDNESMSFAGLNYNNSVEYTTPLWNNPLSFQRTYNPVYDATKAASDGWGINAPDGTTKNVIQNYQLDLGGTELPVKEVTEAISLLPYNNYSDENPEINWDQIVSSIYSGNLPSTYYSNEVQADASIVDGNPLTNPDGSGWAKMAYLGWKTLGMNYLRSLNLYANKDLEGMTVGTLLSTMSKQWPDYGEMFNSFHSFTSKSTVTQEQRVELLNKQLWFYKKYVNGIPLDYTKTGKELDGSSPEEVFDEIFNALCNKKTPDSDTFSVDAFKTSYDPGDDGKFGNDAFYDPSGHKIDMTKLNATDKLNPSDIAFYNTALAHWMYGHVFNRIGTILLETSYSRAPYFVQQKMKSAYINGTNYSLAFNVSPYNSKTDDLGTMLNATYQDVSGKSNDIKIYGIDENQKTVSVNYNKLASYNASDNVVPIILNQTAKIKANLHVGDVVDYNYVLNQLEDTNGSAATLGDNSSDLNTNVSLKKYARQNDDDLNHLWTESQSTYYATDNSYVNSPTSLMDPKLTPATVAGKEISAVSSDQSTAPNEMLKASTHGEVRVGAENIKQKFVVVDFQNSYGKAQGWITNANANHLMNYDVTQKYDYENFFIPQTHYVFNHISQYPSLSSMFEGGFKLSDVDTYDNLMTRINAGSQGAAVVKKMFDNMYPIYNYKNSLDPENYDITQVVNTNQRFGDFSAMGLNGGVDDSGVYYTGFGQGATSLIYPVTTARQILEQITTIVDMIIILFIIVAFVVSLTMILLTTSLIIRENMSFIATMKILGYSNRYIVRQILGMYIVGIIIAFIVGFLIAWFGILELGNLLAIHSSWVLPIQFYIWYPFAVFGLLTTVYVVSTAIGYSAIRKIHPLVALQYEK